MIEKESKYHRARTKSSTGTYEVLNSPLFQISKLILLFSAVANAYYICSSLQRDTSCNSNHRRILFREPLLTTSCCYATYNLATRASATLKAKPTLLEMEDGDEKEVGKTKQNETYIQWTGRLAKRITQRFTSSNENSTNNNSENSSNSQGQGSSDSIVVRIRNRMPFFNKEQESNTTVVKIRNRMPFFNKEKESNITELFFSDLNEQTQQERKERQQREEEKQRTNDRKKMRPTPLIRKRMKSFETDNISDERRKVVEQRPRERTSQLEKPLLQGTKVSSSETATSNGTRSMDSKNGWPGFFSNKEDNNEAKQIDSLRNNTGSDDTLSLALSIPLAIGGTISTSLNATQAFLNDVVRSTARKLASRDVAIQGEEKWVVACPKTRISPGEAVPVVVGGIDLLLIASNDAKRLYCVANQCPHLGTPLETGKLERRSPEKTTGSTEEDATLLQDDCIVCPLHHTAFALDSGEVRGEWCPYPPIIGSLMGAIKPQANLPTFAVRYRGKSIEVRLNSALEKMEENKTENSA